MNDKRDRDLFARQAPHKVLDVLDELTWATGRTKFMNLKSDKNSDNIERGHWENVSLEFTGHPEVLEAISKDHVVTCFDAFTTLSDPTAFLDFLAAAYRKGALIFTSMRTNETDDLKIFERILPEYHAALRAAGLPPLFVGLDSDFSSDGTTSVVSIHEPRLQRHFASSVQRPLAILSCFNESDVIEQVIEHWIAEGCCLQILDNWSTDHSWSLLIAVAERFGDLVTIERFPLVEPVAGSWEDILRRKEEIAEANQGRWIIHTDADEIRCSPFFPFKLADALALVESAGWNRVDFTVLNHRPVDDRPVGPGALVASLPYFEFGTKPGHFIQKKAWIQGGVRVNLAGSGGHVADFEGARDCPYRFVLHHYPLRSPEHARRKINHERAGRWSTEETQRGWHNHYNDLLGSDRIVWELDDLHDSRRHFWEQHGWQVLLGPMMVAERGRGS